MIVNRNIDQSVPVHLKIEGSVVRPNAAKAWLLSGPSPIATNLTDPDAISIREVPVEVRQDAYYIEMAACSMVAIEVAP